MRRRIHEIIVRSSASTSSSSPSNDDDDNADEEAVIDTDDDPDDNDNDNEEEEDVDVDPIHTHATLSEPGFWRSIVEQAIEANKDPRAIWADDIAPVIGLPFPIGNTVLDYDRRRRLAPQMRAIGTALTAFPYRSRCIDRVLDAMCYCDYTIVAPVLRNVDEVLGNV